MTKLSGVMPHRGAILHGPLDPLVPKAPAPYLHFITPSSAIVGAADFTMEVRGSGFLNGDQIIFNGGPETTVFVDSTKLTTLVKPSTASPLWSKIPVQVKRGAYLTRPAVFSFVPIGQTLSSVAPSSVVVATPQVLTVTGTNFRQGDAIAVDHAPVATVYDSATQLHTSAPQIFAAAGSHAVTVQRELTDPVAAEIETAPRTLTVTLTAVAVMFVWMLMNPSNVDQGVTWESATGDAQAVWLAAVNNQAVCNVANSLDGRAFGCTAGNASNNQYTGADPNCILVSGNIGTPLAAGSLVSTAPKQAVNDNPVLDIIRMDNGARGPMLPFYSVSHPS